ncbi:MAG: hypothetical protein M3O70_12330 [Actinomycetota bacterium]|nr:hypothetical protein [Actinomycetota bacterium]
MVPADWTPGELSRQLDRIERRIEKVELKLEERYVPMASYNQAIKVLDDRINRQAGEMERQAESAANTRRMVIMIGLGFVGQVLLVLIAALVR